MATRNSNRPPRAFDVNKQLPIVRDISELDSLDGLNAETFKLEGSTADAVTGGHMLPAKGAAAGGQPGTLVATAKKPKAKEIPVPEVKEVPTYTRDYLPTFRIPSTYIHGKGGSNFHCEDFVEYDLDNDDEDWLDALNRGGDNRLSDVKFERMLWKLELLWSECCEAQLSERANANTLSSITCLPKQKALVMLKWAVGGRDVILEAVYEYWAAKRKRTAKPLLKRLQAPTNPNDTDPHHVFRPRERVNRPLTRRRRENTAECLDKLRHIQGSLLKALQLAELTVLRERKKQDIHHAEMTLQRCQLNLQHQPPALHAGIEGEAMRRLNELMARSSQADRRITTYLEAQSQQGATAVDAEVRSALTRKKQRLDTDSKSSSVVSKIDALAVLPPPLGPPELEPLFAFQPDMSALLGGTHASRAPGGSADAARGAASTGPGTGSSAVTGVQPPQAVLASLAAGRLQPYVGRGGRLVMARTDPLSMQPLAAQGTDTAAPGGSRATSAADQLSSPPVGGAGGTGGPGHTAPGAPTLPLLGAAAPGTALSGLGSTTPQPLGGRWPSAHSTPAASGGAAPAGDPGSGAATPATAPGAARTPGQSQPAAAPGLPGTRQVVDLCDWQLVPHTMSEAVLFPWCGPRCEPWAASLDLDLLPSCVARAPILAQRAARAAPPDYTAHLLAATHTLQAAQDATYGPPPATAAAGGRGAGGSGQPAFSAAGARGSAPAGPMAIGKGTVAASTDSLAARSAALGPSAELQGVSHEQPGKVPFWGPGFPAHTVFRGQRASGVA